MATLSVGPTSTYPSIAAAMPAANPGDTIQLEADYSNELVTVTQGGIIFTGEASSVGIVLQLGSGIPTFTVSGTAPFEIRDAADANGIVGNSGDNLITVSDGVDAVDGGLGVDHLVVDYQLATGAITGDTTSNITEAGGGGRSVTITSGTIEHFVILTGSGTDTLTTHDGDDLISVGAGPNTVTAGAGANTILGGDDADTITTGDGNDFIIAGEGTNTVVAGQGANRITGGSSVDSITALDGGNFIDGGDGTNVLTSGDGDDTILSGTGAGTLVAGGGSDEIIVRGGGAVTLDAGAGNDRLTVDYSAATTSVIGGITGGNLGAGYTGFIADAATSTLDFQFTENLTVITGSGNDSITTGDGTDVLDGGAGNDILTSGDGADTFTGGAGDDGLNGGTGIDTAVYSGQRGDYAITLNASGEPTSIVDNRLGSPDGTDVLTGIELAVFANTLPTGSVVISGTPTEDQILTASNTLADVDGLGPVTYQWQADGVDIVGATDTSVTLTQLQVGAAITVIARYTDQQATVESVASTPTAAVANVNDAPTGSVTISGTPAEDQILTASNTLADEDGLGAVTYQWRAAGEDIVGATGATFTLSQAEVGKTITVAASYIDQQATAERVTSSPTAAVANVNDAPTGAVTISGTPAEDQILTASNTLADEDGLGAVTYQWRADGENIAGATGATLTLTQAQVDTAITVVARYTDQQATAERVLSLETREVANRNDAPTGSVTISGTPAEDQILTASNTLADEDGLGAVTYQWRAAGEDIVGATGATFTLSQAQVGKTITVVARYVDQYDRAERVASSPTAAVANVNDAPTGAVTISGTPAEDQILTVSNTLADEDGLGAVTYQWRAAGEDIAGATGATFTLSQAQVGKTITVAASYIDQQATAERVTSSPTAAVVNVNDAPTGAVTISGTPAEDQILTASNTLADEDGLGAVTYQWRAAGEDIVGATGATFTLSQAQVGKTITVAASYIDQQATAERVASTPTAAVANANDAPTGAVTISGTPAEDQILTASNTLADEDGLGAVTYQWRAAGEDIVGATGATFTLSQAQVGKTITVAASYIDQRSTAERVASAPTAAVANVNDAPTGAVTISGTPAEDQILTASNTLADEDGLGAVTYQWRAAGEDIVGATGATFTLSQAQVGKTITVAASYIDQQATAERVASTPTAAVANVNDAPTGAVTISGTPAEDQILTASNTLADEDGLGAVTYQWQADGENIVGANDVTFTLSQAQVGKTITAIASYTDQQGTAESVPSNATSLVAPGLPSFSVTVTATNVASQVEAIVYTGPVTYLAYEFAGSNGAEAAVGTAANDFMHMGAGNDAAAGGDGDDVLDGGTGSNFLTGNAGRDVFFLDGRNGAATWSTVTDWHAGEELALWGWRSGVSKATWTDDAGTSGYRGVTMHADLDSNGVIDTSVTWAGRTRADVAAPTDQGDLLWFA